MRLQDLWTGVNIHIFYYTQPKPVLGHFRHLLFFLYRVVAHEFQRDFVKLELGFKISSIFSINQAQDILQELCQAGYYHVIIGFLLHQHVDISVNLAQTSQNHFNI